jgi:hypothetical protein
MDFDSNKILKILTRQGYGIANMVEGIHEYQQNWERDSFP